MLLVRQNIEGEKKLLQITQQKSYYFQEHYWLKVLMIFYSWNIIFIVSELPPYLLLFDKNRDIKTQGIILINPMALLTELCFTASVLAKDDIKSSCWKL